MKVIGFTGSQIGMTKAQKESLKTLLRINEARWLHHGDCIGADAQASEIAIDLQILTVIHPPTNPSKRAFCKFSSQALPKPYLERNRCIVDSSSMLIAAPKTRGEVLRSGTWSTVRYARKMKKPIVIIFPDGKTKFEP